MNSTVASVLLPGALAVVMFGLGLGLTVADFRRVAVYPRAAGVALACQILLLPAVCFGLVVAFGLPPALAVGMMLLAASPGGPTANLYSHVFGGDVALNVTLTAVNSVLAAVTLPLVTNASLGYFFDGDAAIGLQFDKTVQVFVVVLVPVVLGMLVRARVSGFAERMNRPVKALSVVILLTVIAVAVTREAATLASHLTTVGTISVVFAAISLTVGYWIPRLSGVNRGQAIAAGMEVGIHNSTIAIAIALSPTLLNDARMAIPAVVYGVLVFGVAAVAGFVFRSATAAHAPQEVARATA